MINGFENETHDLTSEELQLVPLIMQGMATKVGRQKAVKSSYIIEKLKERNIRLQPSRLRKIINHIRVNSLQPIIAGKQGYYLPENENDLLESIESLSQKQLCENIQKHTQPIKVSRSQYRDRHKSRRELVQNTAPDRYPSNADSPNCRDIARLP